MGCFDVDTDDDERERCLEMEQKAAVSDEKGTVTECEDMSETSSLVVKHEYGAWIGLGYNYVIYCHYHVYIICVPVIVI
jgi:hypothetical protein